MSDPRVTELRTLLESWDLEAWERGENMSLLDPNVVYEDANLPDHVGEIYRGYEGVARATRRWKEPFEELESELQEIRAVGERLISIHAVRAKAVQSGIEFTGPVAYVWTFREGKVIHFQSFRDVDEAVTAAGPG